MYHNMALVGMNKNIRDEYGSESSKQNLNIEHNLFVRINGTLPDFSIRVMRKSLKEQQK
jgi:hypothetical protein